MSSNNPENSVIRITVLLMTAFGGLTALSIGLVLFISAYNSFNSTLTLMRSRAIITMDALERDIQQHINPALSLIEHFRQLVQTDDLDISDKQSLIMALKGSLAAAPQISGVIIWPGNTSKIRVLRQDGGSPVIASDFKPGDTDTVQLLNNVRKQSGAVWNAPYRVEGKTFISVLAPLFRNGEFQGAIEADISISELSSFIQTLSGKRKLTAYVLYGKSHVLAHPELIGPKFRKLYEKNKPLLSIEELADPVLLNLQNAKPRNFAEKSNFRVYRVTTQTGNSVAFTRPMTAFGKTPWKIGIYGPLTAFSSELIRLRHSIFSGLLLLLAAVLIAIFLARRIAAPIRNTADAAAKIGKFELDEIAPLKASRITELNNQAIAFNQMLEGLKSFETYVPHKLVKRLISQGAEYGAASREMELTVMFTDIVDFTPISEHLSPTDTAQMLNSHFEYINACIDENHGTLDKYIGDAAMAFWGAPERLEDHAKYAARTALCIAKSLEDQPGDERWPDLRIKIALHTGPLIVGNIGAKSRTNYTIIGDTVNTCSRIESLCGELDDGSRVNILLSDETASLIDDEFTLEPVGVFPIKGRKKPVKLWRLVHGQK